MNRSRLFRLATCLCLVFLSCGLTAPLLARPSAETQPVVISLWHDLTAWLRAALTGELSTSPMIDPAGNTGTTSSGEGPNTGPMGDPHGVTGTTSSEGPNIGHWVDPIGKTSTPSSGEGPNTGPWADPIGKTSNTGGGGELNTSPYVDPIG